MCDKCDRLTRENRELREELEEWRATDGGVANVVIEDLARKLRVAPQGAKMALILMRNPGQTITHDRLARAMLYDGADTKRITSVIAHRLRRAGVPVENVWGVGQRIPLHEADRVRAIMS